MKLVDDHITRIDVQHGHVANPNATKVQIHFGRGTVIDMEISDPVKLQDLRTLMMSGNKVSIGIIPGPPKCPVTNPVYAFGSSLNVPGGSAMVDDTDAPKKETPMGFSGCYHTRATYDSGFSKYDYCPKCGHKYED